MTALGNDEGYERIFAGQMENFAKPGDVLIVISASGNSLNLVRAVELARERKVATIGIVGFDGGTLKELVDQPVWVRSEKGTYELVEDAGGGGFLMFAVKPERRESVRRALSHLAYVPIGYEVHGSRLLHPAQV